jgi:small subunit ribosomal protein S9
MEETTTETTVPEKGAATGRRKEAVCRVWVTPGKGEISINGKTKEEYLARPALVRLIMEPLNKAEVAEKVDVRAKVKGGGVSGQAGALRLAIARALTEYDPELRAILKKAGLLTVDARKVERKKYGQPKARKRFQFSKR